MAPAAILRGHTNYIQTIKSDSKNIYTGSTDEYLRIYDWTQILTELSKNGGEIITVEEKFKLKDHEQAIVAIDVDSANQGRFLATASWDKTAKIWKKNSLNENSKKSSLTLLGHEAAVWDVKFIKTDYVLTASADKTICLWSLKQKGAKMITFEGHTDCVRSLLVWPNIKGNEQDTFYSTGNDGTIKLWNTETGEKVSSVQAHANYCYSITGRETDSTTFSCGEDASLLIWNPQTNLTENFDLPCISAWDCDNNGELAVVGTNRGELFIYTDNSSLVKPTANQDFEAAKESFKKEKEADKAKKQKNNENGLSNEELAKIPGPEILTKNGKSDGFIQMVRPNINTKQVDVYQWSAGPTGAESDLGKWVLVGQAMNAPEDSKKLHSDGKYYDRIFDVNADSRPGMSLKLPYNYVENPWKTAQKFIEDNGLDIEELEVIVRFITENIPEDKRKIYLDRETEEDTDMKTDAPESQNQIKAYTYLPETNSILFDNSPPMEKLLSKIKQTFIIEENLLSNITNVKVILKVINDPKITDGVDSNKLFPLLDLLRLAIATADLTNLTENTVLNEIVGTLKRLVGSFCYGNSGPTNESLIIKAVNNLIANADLEMLKMEDLTNFIIKDFLG